MLLAIILLGAGLGYWLVRTYVISEDGDVDIGIAQFIKWAMRVIAVTCIYLVSYLINLIILSYKYFMLYDIIQFFILLQSSIDTPLAMVAVGSSISLYYMITSIKWHNHQ